MFPFSSPFSLTFNDYLLQTKPSTVMKTTVPKSSRLGIAIVRLHHIHKKSPQANSLL